jgi:two-component system, sensor histidine kinase and response regulator
MTQNDIMIVDDNPANLKLLEEMLLQQGHEVRSFPLGRLALAAATKTPPDLILLDINMPEMNGYEVCERLKGDQGLSSIPVIFLSALNEIKDKVKAFQSGAVDYISKPFQFEEVHARVETHLKLHDLQQALQLQNERLEEAVVARTRELAEANGRLKILDRSKNDFLHLISHEFHTPLSGLLGVAELILKDFPSTAENNDLRKMFDQSRRRILTILDDALLMTQIDVSGQQFRSAPVVLHTVLRRAVADSTEFAESRRVALKTPPATPSVILGDEDLLVRALHALLETAVKFSEQGGTVALFRDSALHGRGPLNVAFAKRDSLSVVIESRGRTIPTDALPKFFDLFSIGEAITPGGDLGLGPPVASRILSLFGASVSVMNLDPSGLRITIALPVAAHQH